MASGGFKPNATADFLEEWKAKREKMRAKMLGDIAAATGAPQGANNPNNQQHSGPDRSASAGNCLPPIISSSSSSSYAVARSSSGTALKRPEEETHHPASPSPTAAAAPPPPPGSDPKKAPPQTEEAPCDSPDSGAMACNDSDKGSPSPGKAKEKNGTGPSARKGKGQIEKRKLREKRRSTGVVSMPSNESLDELDDDDGGEKDRKEEEELVQANTFQNEAMAADPVLMETPRPASGRHRSSTGSDEEAEGNIRQRHNRHCRDGAAAAAAAAAGSLELRVEELEKELARERQENDRLLRSDQDKDDVIDKLREEIDLLNRVRAAGAILSSGF
uniref:PRKC, apoptosis, WT1, regulator n=1 Tax=Gasterosteus aculeatus aculeatus TaxID=481459 RepID=A0AAQ4Q7Y6_GASAC